MRDRLSIFCKVALGSVEVTKPQDHACIVLVTSYANLIPFRSISATHRRLPAEPKASPKPLFLTGAKREPEQSVRRFGGIDCNLSV
jgi:hypothetical protein